MALIICRAFTISTNTAFVTNYFLPRGKVPQVHLKFKLLFFLINLRADIRISIRWTIIRIQVTEAGFSAIIRVTT